MALNEYRLLGRTGLRVSRLLQRFDEVSRPASEYPYIFFESFLQNMVSGGTNIVRPRSAAAD